MTGGADRSIRWTTIGCVAFLALIAGTVSYLRVRTAMATQTRDQGRYLGGRPPYGYRLADAGPHPNKAYAARGRRAHRLEPDPHTAPVVRWMFGPSR